MVFKSNEQWAKKKRHSQASQKEMFIWKCLFSALTLQKNTH